MKHIVLISLWLVVGTVACFSDVIQFGWKVEEAPLDGATRIIDWRGQYTNLATGASAPNGTYGNFDNLTPADAPFLTDPESGVVMTGSEAWAMDGVTTGTFEAAQHYMGINEGATTKVDADEAMVFVFDRDVTLMSLGWQGWSSAEVELSYAGITVTNAVNALFDFGDVVLGADQPLKVKVLSGETRVSGLTVYVEPPPLLSLVQFGWKVEEPPLDGANRIIDWKGQYTNNLTGANAPNGTYGNFDGLTAAEDPHLIDPVSSLVMSGAEVWADYLVTSGTLETAQHYLGVLEGGTDKIDPGEAVVFRFDRDVYLQSIAWQAFIGAEVEIGYADVTVTNTASALFDFGNTLLTAGDDLLIRVLAGTTRVAGITVAVEVTNQPPVFINDPILAGGGIKDFAYQGSLASYAVDPNDDLLIFTNAGGPAWLTIDSDGSLSGTPLTDDVGTSTWTVLVSDGISGGDTAQLEIVVADALPEPPTPQTGQTNIVFIFIDDLGWMDLGVQGSAFYETPNIDRLAAEGIRFTDAYASHPRCLPSRYGVLSGRFPGANGVPGGSPENNLVPDDPGTEPHEGTYTLGEALQTNGYETCFLGKWHLIGQHGSNNLPQYQGFDVNITGGANGSPPTYFFPYSLHGEMAVDELNEEALFLDNTTGPGGLVTDRITGHSYVRTAYRGGEGEYITDRLTDEALDWMTYNADKPMFLYLSHYGVHTPFEAPTGLVAKYEAKLATMDYGDLPEYIPSGIGDQKMRQDFPTYAAMIESVDQSVGRILDKLDELGIASNTLVMFTSDNGGLSNRGGYNTRELATANYPLRTGKGWLYEGGIREPLLARLPGFIPTNTVSDAVVNGSDFYATFLDLAGLPSRTNDHEDSVSFVEALKGNPYDRGKPVFWHSPLARPYSTGDFNSSAVRDGDYKLIYFYDTPGQPVELYNVVLDIGENTNLVSQMPGKAQELLSLIQTWYTQTHQTAFKVDDDDVARPPSDYLDDPTAPIRAMQDAGASFVLQWDDWTGFAYRLQSRTNLLSGTWTNDASGVLTNEVSVPAAEDERYYRMQLELEPSS